MPAVPRPRRARRSPRGSLVWLAAIVAVGIGLGVLASIPLLRGPANGTHGSPVGEPAPPLDAADLDGRRWTLDDGAGRLRWVNFWAASCPPCRTEMPAMQRLAELYGDRLLILGVDAGESRETVASFVARYAIDYPVLLDSSLTAYDAWAVGGLPRHYFVDERGVVVREVIGPLDPADMVDILNGLLGPA